MWTNLLNLLEDVLVPLIFVTTILYIISRD